MAILKHIANKNRNYNTALEYLMFQHNEFTQQPLRDDLGNMILRDEYYLDGLNCDLFTFAAECDQVNRSFCKNSSDREIKSHHYIISFDPRDVTESGLTGNKAQLLGLEFARKYFAGHQALVCTHTDGHNESGNIHVHIILNSVRKTDIEPSDLTDRPCDSRAGFKHHLTDKLLSHMQQTLMDICEREHLHQVDLLSPSADKVREREYWKKKRENDRMAMTDRGASEHIDEVGRSSGSKFQTQKQYLRNAIREVSSYANSAEEFGAELKAHYGITFKISRGRYSYLHPERSKYITGRNLGDNYTEQYLVPLFEGNKVMGRSREDMMPAESQRDVIDHYKERSLSGASREYDPSYDYRKDPVAALHFHTRIRLVVDLQNCAKAQISRAYAHKVKLTNLQQMAQTICFVQENGIDSRKELQALRLSKEASLQNLQTKDPSYQTLRKQVRELHIICHNVDSILQADLHQKKSRGTEKAQSLD